MHKPAILVRGTLLVIFRTTLRLKDKLEIRAKVSFILVVLDLFNLKDALENSDRL